MSRRVLCVPTEFVPRFYGFVPANAAPFEPGAYGLFVDKDEAEKNPEMLQIIPYVLFHPIGMRAGSRQFLAYNRQPGGDYRLTSSLSIGFGGHLEPKDAIACNFASVPEQLGDGWTCSMEAVHEIAMAGMKRECHEEGGITIADRPPVLGYIHNFCNDVGKVHLGVLYSHPLTRSEIDHSLKVGDGCQKFGWITASEIVTWERDHDVKEGVPSFERWSTIAAHVIEGVL